MVAHVITLGGSGTGLVSGLINGSTAENVMKTGTGTWTIAGNGNTFLGATTVAAGVLNIQVNSGLGTTKNGTSVLAGAALQLQNNITTSDALNLAGTGVADDGALRNISGNNTYGGTITLNSNVRINSDSDTLTLSNSVNGAAANAGLGAFDLTIGGDGNTTISGAIGNQTTALYKDGAGTLLLSGHECLHRPHDRLLRHVAGRQDQCLRQ